MTLLHTKTYINIRIQMAWSTAGKLDLICQSHLEKKLKINFF